MTVRKRHITTERIGKTDVIPILNLRSGKDTLQSTSLGQAKSILSIYKLQNKTNREFGRVSRNRHWFKALFWH